MGKKIGEILKTLIHEETHITFDEQGKVITLLESEDLKASALRSVTIKGIEEFYFALKLDHNKYKFLGTIFKDVKHIGKACDAVIFCRVKDRNYIFLIELKSQKADYVPEKIKSTKAFLDYLGSLLSKYYQLDLKGFIQVSILFDRKANKGKPNLVEKDEEKYYHHGFKNPDNEVRIRLFIEEYS